MSILRALNDKKVLGLVIGGFIMIAISTYVTVQVIQNRIDTAKVKETKEKEEEAMQSKIKGLEASVSNIANTLDNVISTRSIRTIIPTPMPSFSGVKHQAEQMQIAPFLPIYKDQADHQYSSQNKTVAESSTHRDNAYLDAENSTGNNKTNGQPCFIDGIFSCCLGNIIDTAPIPILLVYNGLINRIIPDAAFKNDGTGHLTNNYYLASIEENDQIINISSTRNGHMALAQPAVSETLNSCTSNYSQIPKKASSSVYSYAPVCRSDKKPAKLRSTSSRLILVPRGVELKKCTPQPCNESAPENPISIYVATPTKEQSIRLVSTTSFNSSIAPDDKSSEKSVIAAASNKKDSKDIDTSAIDPAAPKAPNDLIELDDLHNKNKYKGLPVAIVRPTVRPTPILPTTTEDSSMPVATVPSAPPVEQNDAVYVEPAIDSQSEVFSSESNVSNRNHTFEHLSEEEKDNNHYENLFNGD
ncbi:hypothetical protein NEOKW01_1822 [Nematocida sp. AWRm80]|nr:hypothetical protein NEOKW01_1822 [Nematocida sp. AWRm80]